VFKTALSFSSFPTSLFVTDLVKIVLRKVLETSRVFIPIFLKSKDSLGSLYVHVSCPIQQVDGVFP